MAVVSIGWARAVQWSPGTVVNWALASVFARLSALACWWSWSPTATSVGVRIARSALAGVAMSVSRTCSSATRAPSD
jgi:hypothetical protein